MAGRFRGNKFRRLRKLRYRLRPQPYALTPPDIGVFSGSVRVLVRSAVVKPQVFTYGDELSFVLESPDWINNTPQIPALFRQLFPYESDDLPVQAGVTIVEDDRGVELRPTVLPGCLQSGPFSADELSFVVEDATAVVWQPPLVRLPWQQVFTDADELAAQATPFGLDEDYWTSNSTGLPVPPLLPFLDQDELFFAVVITIVEDEGWQLTMPPRGLFFVSSAQPVAVSDEGGPHGVQDDDRMDVSLVPIRLLVAGQMAFGSDGAELGTPVVVAGTMLWKPVWVPRRRS